MPDRAYPRLEGFERLAISDGLTIDAARWQQAHDYHRQRQNFQYQALYEPGIVYGLGVAPLLNQPDRRLLQIQPGVAIDIEGNPIIIPAPEEFRITSEAAEGQPLLVHLVVNYVDPTYLRRTAVTQMVQETFRIVEKLHLEPRDVEICRILLLPDPQGIRSPINVFHPTTNELDFRSRRFPRPYSPLAIQVGQVTSDQAVDTKRNLLGLVRSLDGLYPSLKAQPTVQTFSASGLAWEPLSNCQLLHIPYRVLLSLSNPALQRLNDYLAEGRVLLVVVDFAEAELLELLDIGRELRAGLAEAERDRELIEQLGTQIQAEITENLNALAERQEHLEQSLAAIAPTLGISLADSGAIDSNHPLCWQPFTFSQFPTHLGHPILIKNWQGLVLMVGDLSQDWGATTALNLPRDVVRSAQEWGVNLLHFAAQRCQWMRDMRSSSVVISGATSVPTSDSLQQRTEFLPGPTN
jgi:hypothetical protein